MSWGQEGTLVTRARLVGPTPEGEVEEVGAESS